MREIGIAILVIGSIISFCSLMVYIIPLLGIHLTIQILSFILVIIGVLLMKHSK